MFLSPTSHHRILVADDEASVRLVLTTCLTKAGFSVTSAKDGQEAIDLLKASQSFEDADPFHAVIADIRMPQVDGMQLLKHVVAEYEDLPVILLTAHGTVDLAVQALKEGAFDFLTKPFEREDVVTAVKKALGQNTSSLATKTHDNDALERLVGRSAPMQRIRDVIQKVAKSPSTVLITGESGTGKELVAHALHYMSERQNQPFIRINCAAIPETLIESELFGYEKGAFTGAVTSKPGRFELASGGTLFLDEIGDLPIEVQVKLLRALQESSFERVGGIKTIEVNIRLVAATNRNLQEAITEGTFREDLYYRLNVVPIHLPPLRERASDVPMLIEHFVRKYNKRLQKEVLCFTDEAVAQLKAYSWPGNIRELENIIERTLLFSDSKVIDVADLPPDVCSQNETPIPEDASMKDIVRHKTAEIERELIMQALKETGDNVTHAAKALKISRKSLQLKMKELGLRED